MAAPRSKTSQSVQKIGRLILHQEELPSASYHTKLANVRGQFRQSHRNLDRPNLRNSSLATEGSTSPYISKNQPNPPLNASILANPNL